MIQPESAPPNTQAQEPSATQTSQEKETKTEELEEAIRKQIEYYFSPANLAHDSYLVSQMDGDMYLPIGVIAQCHRVAALTTDCDLMMRVMKDSSKVIVDEARQRLKPNVPTRPRSTVIIRDLDTTEEVIRTLVDAEQCDGSIVRIRKELGNTWFVTLDTEECAKKCLDGLHNKQHEGKNIQARIKSENLLRGTYQPRMSREDNPLGPSNFYQQPGLFDPRSQPAYFPYMQYSYPRPYPGPQGGPQDALFPTPVRVTRGMTGQRRGGRGGKRMGQQGPRRYGQGRGQGAPSHQQPPHAEKPQEEAEATGQTPPAAEEKTTQPGAKAQQGEQQTSTPPQQFKRGGRRPSRSGRRQSMDRYFPTGSSHFPPLPSKTGYKKEFRAYDRVQLIQIVTAMPAESITCPESLRRTHPQCLLSEPNAELEIAKPLPVATERPHDGNSLQTRRNSTAEHQPRGHRARTQSFASAHGRPPKPHSPVAAAGAPQGTSPGAAAVPKAAAPAPPAAATTPSPSGSTKSPRIQTTTTLSLTPSAVTAPQSITPPVVLDIPPIDPVNLRRKGPSYAEIATGRRGVGAGGHSPASPAASSGEGKQKTTSPAPAEAASEDKHTPGEPTEAKTSEAVAPEASSETTE
eukprot:gnl/Trimastix_PCT/1976.p1 GENE.gnl/Trimastix_PCT/1976~~gnl/Trimastix_PCT/1976.p1  ORF type:complete len:630 (+),score=130.51 gnl/Trimastix_PCT/1976:37-1926(+)